MTSTLGSILRNRLDTYKCPNSNIHFRMLLEGRSVLDNSWPRTIYFSPLQYWTLISERCLKAPHSRGGSTSEGQGRAPKSGQPVPRALVIDFISHEKRGRYKLCSSLLSQEGWLSRNVLALGRLGICYRTYLGVRVWILHSSQHSVLRMKLKSWFRYWLFSLRMLLCSDIGKLSSRK